MKAARSSLTHGSTTCSLEDLVSHLHSSDARYRAAAPAEFLDRNQPPIFITLFFIVTRLPDSLRSVRDHFLSLDPTVITVDLLEQHLLAAKTSVVALGAARGTRRTPFSEGCSPFPLAPSYASAAAFDVLGAEKVGAASASGKRRSSKGKGGKGGGGGSRGGGGGSSGGGGGGGGGGGSGSGDGSGGLVAAVVAAVGVVVVAAVGVVAVGLELLSMEHGVSGGSGSCPYVIHTGDCAGQTCGKPHTQHCCFSRLDDAWRAEFGDKAERPRWAEMLRSGVAIFDLDYDAILAAMYALSVSVEGDSYQCVPPDLGIEPTALAASEFSLPGTAPAEALHTFTLDSGASRYFFRDNTTLTPLSAPVPNRLADPSGSPVLARSSTILPCPAVPSGSLSCLHLSLFSKNLVSTAALQDAMVTTTTPGGQRASICTCTQTGRHLATFTRRPGSSLYTLATEPPQTLLWHHHLGHPSLPGLHGMHSRLLVSGLPRSLPPLPPCLPCVNGRQRAAPHSSSFPPTTAPLQTLHMDVWGPAHVSGQGRERYFPLVVDDYTRYTTVFRLRRKGRRHIGLVMEVARTSMIHANASHFLWPFAVQYAAHQLNLWPHVSLQETSPTLRWTGEVGDASVFRDVTFDESVPFYRLFPYRSAPPPLPPFFFAPVPPPVDPLPPQGPAPSGVSQLDPLPGTVPVEVAVDSGDARGVASGGAASVVAELGGAEPGGAEPGSAESEGAGSGGAKPGGAEPGGAEPAGVESGGAEPTGVEPGGAESGGAKPRGTASSGGPARASPRLSPRPEPLSPLQLRKWFTQRTRLRSGAARAGDSANGDTRVGGAAAAAGAGGTGGAAAAGLGGACTWDTGAAETGGVGGAGAGDPTQPGGAGAGGAGAGGTGAGGSGAGEAGAVGAGAGGAGAVDRGAGGAGAGGAVSGGTGGGGTVRPRPYFVPLLQQVLGVPSSTGLTVKH
ncbi:unnamed protein product [Closterium sp. NIES-53]